MELNLVISKTPVIYLLQARARVNNQAVADTKELMSGKDKELNRLQKSLEKAQYDQVSRITIIILYLLPFVYVYSVIIVKVSSYKVQA